MSSFLLYHRITKDTGVKLAEDLGIPAGDEVTQERLETLIRWGNGQGIRYNPEVAVNSKAAIETATNKQRCMEIFERERIKTPKIVNRVPCVARTAYHTQGQGLWLCWKEEQKAEVRREGADYFIEYIPVAQEWRVHVIEGEVVFVQPKYSRKRQTSAFGGVQEFRDNWHKRFVNPNEAPTNACIIAARGTIALGLNFGGADVIEGLDGKCYLLEVNTGPSLPTQQTREPYVEYFKTLLNR